MNITSFRLGSVTRLNTDLMPAVRFLMGTGWTGAQESPTYTIALQVNDGGGPSTLCEVTVPFAESVAAVERVAKVALQGGTKDRDIERMSEAFKLFANNPKLKGDILESTIGEAAKLIEVYWAIRLRLDGQSSGEQRFELPNQTVVVIT